MVSPICDVIAGTLATARLIRTHAVVRKRSPGFSGSVLSDPGGRPVHLSNTKEKKVSHRGTGSGPERSKNGEFGPMNKVFRRGAVRKPAIQEVMTDSMSRNGTVDRQLMPGSDRYRRSG